MTKNNVTAKEAARLRTISLQIKCGGVGSVGAADRQWVIDMAAKHGIPCPPQIIANMARRGFDTSGLKPDSRLDYNDTNQAAPAWRRMGSD